MVDRVHTRGDEIALEDDFEWVNAWATAALAPSADAAVSPMVAADDVDDVRAAAFEVAVDNVSLPVASATGEHPDAMHADQHGDIVAPDFGSEPGSAPIPFFEAARRIGRWTNLFRMVTRAGAPGADAARDLFVSDAPGLAVPLEAPRSAADAGRADGMVDAAQLARDIAEIVAVRDRLLAMPVGMTRGSHERSAPVRTSDYVPILVGAVLAFTSLIVFGAAASFVSLR